MSSIRKLACVLALLAVAACGDATDAEREGAAVGDPATLTPEAPAEDVALAVDDEPASTRFQMGEHYDRLSPTQPKSSPPDQIEVAEVFWYGCPHCNEFEPFLARWEDSKPGDVSFIRIPAVWNELVRLHARAFYTAEALGTLDAMHDELFAEIHERGNRLDTREALAAFFGRYGVEPDAFTDAFDSYDVHAKLQRAEELIRHYRVTSVPSVVVNGKYTSNAIRAGGYDQLIELIDELAESERSTR